MNISAFADELYWKSKLINAMVLKVVELLASSKESWEDAAQQAVKQAARSLYNIRSIYIKEQSAKVMDSKIVEYRINAQITFALADADDE